MSENQSVVDYKRINYIKEICTEYLGAEETDSVFKNADKLLNEIQKKYCNISKKQKMHTDLIFSHIAVYKALSLCHGDKAMKIMENGEAVSARESAAKFQKIVKMPFGKTIFLKGFAAGCKSGFGTEAGFSNVVHKADKNVYQMDITACPYAKYCNAENCGELTHIFCNNDIYAYGNLEGIRFTRTQTLGTGGEKCDFLLERKKRSMIYEQTFCKFLRNRI